MLDDSVIIEVIALKNGLYYRSVMTVLEYRNFKKKSGFSYSCYELGFSQFKIEHDDKS